MRASPVLLGLSLSNYVLGLSRRNIVQPSIYPNGTVVQPKRYILEFEPVSDQPILSNDAKVQRAKYG